VPHTVEEAYELAEAATEGDDEKLRDELGDVLFQVHFLSLLLEEREEGSLADVAEGVRQKLIRRHPHVFPVSEGAVVLGELRPATNPVDREAEESTGIGGGENLTAGQVLSNWDKIKKEVEGRGADDPFSDVPENLPGLLYARKILRRIDPSGGSSEPLDGAARDEAERRVGEMLLQAVALSRELGVDPELAIRSEARRRREEHRAPREA
jgi:NTP pyrophosphatase (non-canonical NTP hydrolase)